MPWRLPAANVVAARQCRTRRCFTTAPADPLRILFCGSDAFSIASLRALTVAQRDLPRLIEVIEVVHRPPKRTGSGLKTLRPVPIQQVATQELALRAHAIDSFTGWSPPASFNLLIAVSFGLFVPPRILDLVKYGGLNVHPSLLPDLRGPAPIHHSLIKSRSHTGVSIQTLHPAQFDRGLVLAQTPKPGIPIDPGTTPAVLAQKLAPIGAGMLVDVLKSGAFVSPLTDVAWYGKSGEPIDHAEKITKQHRFIDFSKATLKDILTIHHILGRTWCLLPNGDRLLIDDIKDLSTEDDQGRMPGIFTEHGVNTPLVRTVDGRLLSIVKSTYAGGKVGSGNPKAIRVLSLK